MYHLTKKTIFSQRHLSTWKGHLRWCVLVSIIVDLVSCQPCQAFSLESLCASMSHSKKCVWGCLLDYFVLCLLFKWTNPFGIGMAGFCLLSVSVCMSFFICLASLFYTVSPFYRLVCRCSQHPYRRCTAIKQYQKRKIWYRKKKMERNELSESVCCMRSLHWENDFHLMQCMKWNLSLLLLTFISSLTLPVTLSFSLTAYSWRSDWSAN